MIREKDIPPIIIDLSFSEYKKMKTIADLQKTTITRFIHAMVREYLEDANALEEMNKK